MATAATFVQVSGRDSPVRFPPALGTNKTIRPPSVKKPFVTAFLSLKFLVEGDPAHFAIIWFAFDSTHNPEDKIVGELSQ
jgi:hypothetical protein